MDNVDLSVCNSLNLEDDKEQEVQSNKKQKHRKSSSTLPIKKQKQRRRGLRPRKLAPIYTLGQIEQLGNCLENGIRRKFDGRRWRYLCNNQHDICSNRAQYGTMCKKHFDEHLQLTQNQSYEQEQVLVEDHPQLKTRKKSISYKRESCKKRKSKESPTRSSSSLVSNQCSIITAENENKEDVVEQSLSKENDYFKDTDSTKRKTYQPIETRRITRSTTSQKTSSTTSNNISSRETPLSRSKASIAQSNSPSHPSDMIKISPLQFSASEAKLFNSEDEMVQAIAEQEQVQIATMTPVQKMLEEPYEQQLEQESEEEYMVPRREIHQSNEISSSTWIKRENNVTFDSDRLENVVIRTNEKTIDQNVQTDIHIPLCCTTVQHDHFITSYCSIYNYEQHAQPVLTMKQTVKEEKEDGEDFLNRQTTTTITTPTCTNGEEEECITIIDFIRSEERRKEEFHQSLKFIDAHLNKLETLKYF
ncbi:unnamed protein product [Didymodactylos carnosus]|uniref:Uncharacterized protein n=1 Tax=Didymodactylos carnosus TaxID=1234261 RepID=A0A814I0D4_9BILA|nr:unnamed protein product [Didymodactylos carnosus]CAF1017047.1 unnamed protein product [Didymodactylos carnosus]CAF3693284.1 unnamed protein product [Didymodactylos carnosus]CAF3788581.1 unnamed protein product [Didymodactylos carnosus]